MNNMNSLSPNHCIAALAVLLTACQVTVEGVTDTSKDPESTTASADTGDATTAPKTTDSTSGDLDTTGPDSTSTGKPDSTGGTTTGTGDTTGTTTGDTTGTTGKTTGDTTGTTSTTTGDTTGDTTGTTSTTGDTTGTTSTTGDTGTTGGTTGGIDPDCGNVPADMACVPANTFEMGTSLNTFLGLKIDAWERPGHTVTISKSFWIDRTEVTVEDYAVCWALKACELPMQGPKLNWGVMGKEKHPANGVNWYQAKKYCEWKGKRLPTEAEWELAARGDDGRMFPWGNEKPTCDYVSSDSCGTSGTVPVGSKPLGDSPYGLHDMAGNVAEWCSDYYKEDYYYQSPVVDPQGPVDGTKRSARSLGVFVYPPNTGLERATYRAGWSPLGLDVNPAVTGFRCAQTAP